MIKVKDLRAQCEVFQQRRPRSGGPQRILVVGNHHALRRGQSLGGDVCILVERASRTRAKIRPLGSDDFVGVFTGNPYADARAGTAAISGPAWPMCECCKDFAARFSAVSAAVDPQPT